MLDDHKAKLLIVDDLPENSPVKKDLAFFEEHFGGVMPIEILVDTGKKKGVLRQKNLEKVNELEAYLDSIPELSSPLSVVSLLKASRQAFYNQNPDYYALPNSRDRNFILRYFQGQEDESGLLNSFVDSGGQTMTRAFSKTGFHSLVLKRIFNI